PTPQRPEDIPLPESPRSPTPTPQPPTSQPPTDLPSHGGAPAAGGSSSPGSPGTGSGSSISSALDGDGAPTPSRPTQDTGDGPNTGTTPGERQDGGQQGGRQDDQGGQQDNPGNPGNTENTSGNGNNGSNGNDGNDGGSSANAGDTANTGNTDRSVFQSTHEPLPDKLQNIARDSLSKKLDEYMESNPGFTAQDRQARLDKFDDILNMSKNELADKFGSQAANRVEGIVRTLTDPTYGFRGFATRGVIDFIRWGLPGVLDNAGSDE
ncbi:hypothetical protein AB8O38_21325, partial [Saccharomonospora xinjiangensis]